MKRDREYIQKQQMIINQLNEELNEINAKKKQLEQIIARHNKNITEATKHSSGKPYSAVLNQLIRDFIKYKFGYSPQSDLGKREYRAMQETLRLKLGVDALEPRKITQDDFNKAICILELKYQMHISNEYKDTYIMA